MVYLKISWNLSLLSFFDFYKWDRITQVLQVNLIYLTTELDIRELDSAIILCENNFDSIGLTAKLFPVWFPTLLLF